MNRVVPILLISGCYPYISADTHEQNMAQKDCVLVDGYTIGDAADIEALAGICEIEGSLDIVGTDLQNLGGLESLTALGGLNIQNNAALTNLDGLSGLVSVGDAVNIAGNDALTGVDGLASLTAVGGVFVLDDNLALSHVDGLARLESVGGDLLITDNTSLAQLDGLSKLASVGSAVSIQRNPSLADIDGLWRLSDFTVLPSTLTLADNRALLRLDGLSGLTAVNDLVIEYNDALIDISGLGGLTTVRDSLTIASNYALCQSLVDAYVATVTVDQYPNDWPNNLSC